MRVFKLRSRLTRSKHVSNACRMHPHSIWRFCAAAAHVTGTTIPQDPVIIQIPHCTLKKKRSKPQRPKSSLGIRMAELSSMVAQIVSAMLKLVGLHFFQDVPTGLGRFLSPPNGFSSFLHDFRPFLVAFSSLPEITPHVTQGCAHLYTNATKKHPKSEPRFQRLT